ncbi:MAG: PAS domain-containing protein [Candidatus Hadarchaeota archaeon]
MSLNVLLVDDEKEILEQAKLFIEREDDRISLETASSAEEGLKMIEDDDIDCVVSDYQMPGKNGLDFLRSVKSRVDDLPFIIFTGKGREEVAMEALNLGADRYLQKGGDPRTQYGVLARAIIHEVGRSEIEAEKEKIEAELTSLVEGSDDSIFVVDEDYRIVFANQALLDRFDLKEGEFLCSQFDKLHPEGDLSVLRRKVKRVIETGESQRQEVNFGGDQYFLRTLSPIENPRTGEIDRVSVISKDITEKKKNEREARRHEEFMENVFNAIQDGISVLSDDLTVKRVNDVMREWNSENVPLEGKKCYEAFRNREEPCERCPTLRCLESGRTESEIIRPSEHVASDRWVELYGYPMKGAGSGEIRQVIEFVRDITKEKKSEENLKRKTQLLDSLMENITDTIYFKDREARFVEVSRSKAEEVGEDAREDLIGRTDFDFYPEGEAKNSYEDDMRVIRGEEPLIRREEKFYEGGDVKWFSTVKIPWKDEEGNIQGLLGISRNITEKKKIEERENFLHSLLRHDVGNKIQVIMGYHDLLSKCEISNKGLEYLEKARSVAEEGVDLIEKVRTLRKIEGNVNIKDLNVESVIERVIGKKEPQALERDIEIEVGNVGFQVKAGALLEELFSNLVENAIKHSDGETIKISGRKKNGECMVIVEDDGKGIPEAEWRNVFEGGYTTDGKSGSGLGLYLVKEIAALYEGDVSLEESHLGGAKFVVNLKLAG